MKNLYRLLEFMLMYMYLYMRVSYVSCALFVYCFCVFFAVDADHLNASCPWEPMQN